MNSKVTALIVAAGSGSRMGGHMPKQYQPVAGKAVLAHAVDALASHPAIDEIRVVIGEGQEQLARQALDGREVGTAYFDTHVVRTMPETILVVVDPSGILARVEVLSFSEPEEYLPRPRWYAQFPGKPLDAELSVKRGVRPVVGATLTARATTAATRRVLALHRVLHPVPARTPAP